MPTSNTPSENDQENQPPTPTTTEELLAAIAENAALLVAAEDDLRAMQANGLIRANPEESNPNLTTLLADARAELLLRGREGRERVERRERERVERARRRLHERMMRRFRREQRRRRCISERERVLVRERWEDWRELFVEVELSFEGQMEVMGGLELLWEDGGWGLW